MNSISVSCNAVFNSHDLIPCPTCRAGIRALQRGLQPLPLSGHRLSHAAAQDGREDSPGHDPTEEGNWPK